MTISRVHYSEHIFSIQIFSFITIQKNNRQFNLQFKLDILYMISILQLNE